VASRVDISANARPQWSNSQIIDLNSTHHERSLLSSTDERWSRSSSRKTRLCEHLQEAGVEPRSQAKSRGTPGNVALGYPPRWFASDPARMGGLLLTQEHALAPPY
jgi:hypothetical protein